MNHLCKLIIIEYWALWYALSDRLGISVGTPYPIDYVARETRTQVAAIFFERA